MDKSVFRFKQFECSHGAGSMKIGVDAVLLGAWVDVEGAARILDAGTGCGVISLMCAQRTPKARILAIDIDNASVEEASANFAASPWASRLEATLEDFMHISLTNIDLIVSNPPYFNSGINHPDTPRLRARHDDSLSPLALIARGRDMLSADGRVAMIVPADRFEEILSFADTNGMGLRRACRVRGHAGAPAKRVMMEFQAGYPSIPADSIPLLTLEEKPGIPTKEHRTLCRDFYLKY